MKIQKTSTLMVEMMATAPHRIFFTVFLDSLMMAIRFTMICINSWISNTQEIRMKRRVGTLRDFISAFQHLPRDIVTHVGPIDPSRNRNPRMPMTKFATISPQTIQM